MKILPNLSFRKVAILGLTVLALALGGTTELWAQALITFFTGWLLILAPPKRSPGNVPALVCVALLVLALAAFLPAAWGPLPPWRHHLADDLQVALPGTRTAQPWLTLESCCLLFVGLAWGSYLFSLNWNSAQRVEVVRVVVFSVTVLAMVAVAAFVFGFRVPGWHQEQNRGWFPNRNHTADVLALCGILSYVLAIDRLRKREASGYFWIAALVPIGAGLVVSYSRAGILMFFGGICLWHLWPTKSQSSKTNRKSFKWTALSVTLVFILLTLFFSFGGETLERFEVSPVQAHTPKNFGEFRLAIQRDAFAFSLREPFLGVGLGNFEALFASARHESVAQNRTIHPESDWLWAACEMGWLAPVLFLVGIGWWLRHAFPFRNRSGESLRRALAAAVVMFILHGFVDVAGHHIGSMWLALLLASLTLPAASSTRPSRYSRPVFSLLGVGLLLISIGWTASLAGAPFPATSATAEQMESRIKAAINHGQVEQVEKLANQALKVEPLRWTFYFQRAYGEVFQRDKTPQAAADFDVARALEPHWAQLALDEGAVWLTANQPELCLDAWTDALAREPDAAGNNYAQMLDQSRDSPVVRDELRSLTKGNPLYLLEFLNQATPEEAHAMLSELMVSDPDLQRLTPDQRAILFARWWDRGDHADLNARLLQHPGWLDEGWFYLARYAAEQKDFQGAWKIVTSHSSPPPLPPASDESLVDLQRDFYDHGTNTGAGLVLCLAQIKQGQTNDALATIQAVEKLPDHPAYIDYLEAQLWAQKQDWELAWNAWLNFYHP